MPTARTATSRSSRGWRGPRSEGEFPTLGWQVLDWTHAYLPSPTDETLPLRYTDDQARRILAWYELDPITGEFVNLELILEEAKGWGKSPFAASLMLASFAGPVCFDGWDADGEPVGVPWGTGGRPPPWIQIAAVSEAQTDNTYSALYAMVVANAHRAAIELGIDDGRTRLYLQEQPGSKLEPVTASAGSREGQRITDAVLDETHLYTPQNGGVKLAATIRRNLAKMAGRAVQTTNAPILGLRSVAEQFDPEHPELSVLHYARRPTLEPDPSWTDEQLLAALDEVYDKVPWIDPRRLLRDIRKSSTDWNDALRFFFNIRTRGAGRAVDPRRWDELCKPRDVPAGTLIGIGFDGSISRDATVLRGCTADGYSFAIASWERPAGADDWKVDRDAVHQAVAEAFARYRVGRMYCDPPKWWTDIDTWAEKYGDEIVLALDTNQERKFAPAVDRWLTGLREGTHIHDGDELATRHVKAAHLRKTRASADDDDGRTLYVLIKGDDGQRIDGAVADVLAHEAAMTMTEPEDSAPRPPRFFG